MNSTLSWANPSWWYPRALELTYHICSIRSRRLLFISWLRFVQLLFESGVYLLPRPLLQYYYACQKYEWSIEGGWTTGSIWELLLFLPALLEMRPQFGSGIWSSKYGNSRFSGYTGTYAPTSWNCTFVSHTVGKVLDRLSGMQHVYRCLPGSSTRWSRNNGVILYQHDIVYMCLVKSVVISRYFNIDLHVGCAFAVCMHRWCG